MKIVLFVFLLLVNLDNPLSEYKWKNRVLLLFGKDITSINQQLALLENLESELTDRDLLVLIVDNNAENATFTEKEVEFLIRRYNSENQDFKAVLIGKDGGNKLSQLKPLTPEMLFGTIDSMPMRQQEMKRN